MDEKNVNDGGENERDENVNERYVEEGHVEYPDYDHLGAPVEGYAPGTKLEIDGELIDPEDLNDPAWRWKQDPEERSGSEPS